MKKMFAKPIFDRKKRLEKTGKGRVEIYIYLGSNQKKYITMRECTLIEWDSYQKSVELISRVNAYNDVILSMMKLREEMTVANFERIIHFEGNSNADKARRKREASPTAFLDYMEKKVKKENLKKVSYTRKLGVIENLKLFGKIMSYADVTLSNIRAWDEWLRTTDIRTEKELNDKNSKPKYRSDVTINNYHKILRRYTHAALLDNHIKKDPYSKFSYPRGKYKERKPLTEEELLVIRSLMLTGKEDRARDLFVFCAYTGLAYIDSQAFDFTKMTEKHGEVYYIDGSRTKTGTAFYSPILPPAMEVLQKYNYQLPHISNQKYNDYLHLIQARANINKPMTSHVARHSFATLVLSHDVPVEKLARMMGHKNILTTQIYAKILKTTIEKHTKTLILDLM